MTIKTPRAPAPPLTTSSGIPLRPVYSAGGESQDRSGADSLPGYPPFLRGAYEEMYRTKLWRIFQLSGYGNPEDEGERLRFLLAQGETGIILEHDRNTADHLYDVDNPEVIARREDVGQTGALIMSVDDYETVLDGLPMEHLYAHPGGGVVQHGPFALASYWTVARRRGIPVASLTGTGQSDFFLTYLGCFARDQIPPEAGLRINCDIIEYCARELPRWVPVSIAGYNGADSGLNAWQEVGAVLANAVAYLNEIERRGETSMAAAARGTAGISLRASMDLFEDAAKLRAARKMWHDLLTSRYGITDRSALRLRIHALTAGSAMTYQQPLNNIVRGTIMALAGVLGGAQSLGVSGYDEAISIPSHHAHQMSVRIQQILQTECGLTTVADPLGGSYYIEKLSQEIEERAWDFFRQIESHGGFIATLDSGWLFDVAALSADPASKSEPVVGVAFATDDICPFQVDGFLGSTDVWDRGMARLASLRADRDQRCVRDSLDALRAACRGSNNIIPVMQDVVSSRASLGEIGNAFRESFGTWQPPIAP